MILSDQRFGGVGQGIGGTYKSGISTPSNGVWYHVISTYAQGIEKGSFVCIDGQCGTATTANNSNGESKFTIGGLSNYRGHGIKGLVATVLVFPRAFDRKMTATAYDLAQKEIQMVLQ